MPEGPEVSILAEQLRNELSGKTITDSTSDSKKFKPAASIFKNSKVSDVVCHGKLLIFLFSDGSTLGNHLGLKGRWSISPGRNVKLTISTSSDTYYFTDAMSLSRFTKNIPTKYSVPDVLRSNVSDLIPVLRAHQRATVAGALINQDYLAGIGNYLRSEIMYKSQIFPKRTISSLSDSELLTLAEKCVEVANESRDLGGSENYYDLYSNPGGYQFTVYRQDTDPKGNQVEILPIGGRKIYYVPELQQKK